MGSLCITFVLKESMSTACRFEQGLLELLECFLLLYKMTLENS